MPELENLPLELDVNVVLRAQGADPEAVRVRRPELVDDAERALEAARPLLWPRALYETYRISDVRHNFLTLEDGTRLRGAFLVEHLAAASEVAVIVCTVGGAIESYTSRLFGVDPVLALALDGVGSAAVEALSVNATRHFEALAAALRRDGAAQPGHGGLARRRGPAPALHPARCGVHRRDADREQPDAARQIAVAAHRHGA